MQSLFYHNRSKERAFTQHLHTKSVQNAITLHPLKRAQYMYRLHSHYMQVKVQDLAYSSILYQRRLAVLHKLLKKGKFGLIFLGTFLVHIQNDSRYLSSMFLLYRNQSVDLQYSLVFLYDRIPANIFLFKVNNTSFGRRCKMCLKLTIKTPERRQ